MAGQSFRFLQAGSLQLHATLQELTTVPEHLAELLIEAPYRSAAEVFQAAVREEVDFVVLTGNVVDPTLAGPRGVAFLQEQFQQLCEREILVYWAASRTDLAGNWLGAIEWPGNVRIFSSEELEEFWHLRGDERLARVLGRSWHEQRPLRAAEFAGDQQGAFSIAVLHGQPDRDSFQSAASYWALGGASVLKSEAVAHCSGQPQGLSPADCGPHGCTLVHVGSDGELRTRMIETDAVRWCHERIAVANSISRPEMRSAFKARLKNLAAAAKRPLLIRWTITGEDRFDTLLADEPSRVELLDWLRDQFGEGTPAAWSVALELEPPDTLPQQWTEEDSILGDFLRVTKRYQDQPDAGLDLERFVFDGDVPPELASVMNLKDGSTRNQVLREAAILGADLLRGDESEVA